MEGFAGPQIGHYTEFNPGRGVKCELGRCENGYIVVVHNPPPPPMPDMDIPAVMNEEFLKGMVDASVEINKAAGGSAHRGFDEEADSWKQEDGDKKEEKAKKKAKEGISKAMRAAMAANQRRIMSRPIYKPVEIFVYDNIEDALVFIKHRMEPEVTK